MKIVLQVTQKILSTSPTPSARKSTLAIEPLFNIQEALHLTLSQLSEGKDVFFGETHIEPSHQLFYALTAIAAKQAGIGFVSALELPRQSEHDLDLFMNTEPMQVDPAISAVKEHIPNLSHESELALRHCLLPTLYTCDVPIIPFDIQPRPHESLDLANREMAASIQKGKQKHANLPVLGLVGARHIKHNGIPQYHPNTTCLRLGTNFTAYGDPNITIYDPLDFNGIVDLPSAKELWASMQDFDKRQF